jgi:integrase
MMAQDRVFLTDKKVRRLRPAKKGERYDVLDALMPNLLVRVTETGHRSWMFRARFPGKVNPKTGRRDPTRRHLGDVGSMTLVDARAKAGRWHTLIEQGIDPKLHEQQEREQQRLAALREKQDTFLTVAEAYFAHLKRSGVKKAADYEREIRNEFVSRWAERPIADIGPADVRAVVEAAVKRDAPSQAHSLFQRARALWGWVLDTGAYGLTSAPTDHMRASALAGRKVVRNRVLSDPELRAVWAAIEQESHPAWQGLYKALWLTGARLTEVTDMSWSELDDKDKPTLWTIPGKRHKSGEDFVRPLSPALIELFKLLPRYNSGDFVFSVDWGKSPVRGLSKPIQRLRARMRAQLGDGPDWRVHDWRRTVRSHLSALPVEQHVRRLVLGHAQEGMDRVYDRFDYLDEKRRALELWAARLHSIVTPPPDNVTPLRRTRARA